MPPPRPTVTPFNPDLEMLAQPPPGPGRAGPALQQPLCCCSPTVCHHHHCLLSQSVIGPAWACPGSRAICPLRFGRLGNLPTQHWSPGIATQQGFVGGWVHAPRGLVVGGWVGGGVWVSMHGDAGTVPSLALPSFALVRGPPQQRTALARSASARSPSVVCGPGVMSPNCRRLWRTLG